MTGVLLRRGEETQREDSRVKTETKIGVMMPQTKGCLGLPETRSSKAGP